MSHKQLLLLGVVCVLGLPHGARAGVIQGTTSAPSVNNEPLQPVPNNRDHYNYASVIDITSLTTLTNMFNTSATAWNNDPANAANKYSWVLAGDQNSAIGKLFTQIDPSDLDVTQYNPWVSNNNPTTGFATGLDGTKYDRGVTNHDAGGADIVIKYTPDAAADDPEVFNFLQAIQTTYAPSAVGTTPANYTRFDNGGAASPFYNDTGVSGVGATEDGNVEGANDDELNFNAEGSFGWMLDIPYRCKAGFPAGGMGCPATTALNDGLISGITSTFDMYIEAPEVVDGTTYNVIFGGLQWGYTYSNDLPEPSSLIIFGSALAGLGALRRRRGKVV